MAQTYTVKAGDTLSAIGQKYGVDYRQITGYKSGDPNKINVGEVLNIPGAGNPNPAAPTATPAITPTPAMQNPSVPAPAAAQSSGGGGASTEFDTAKNEGTWNGVLYRDHNQYLAARNASGGTSSPVNNTIDLQKIYDQANNTPEIQAANAKIKEVTDRLTKQRQEAADAEAIVADNPMYSSGTMQGKIDKIQKKAAKDEQNILNELNLAQSTLATLKGDAQVKTDIALKQYDVNRQQYQDNLARFNTLISSGALSNASGADLASMGSAIGLTPSMIQSMLDKQKKDAVKPHVITSEDDSGNVTVAIVDEATGDIIGKQSLGNIAKSKSGSGESAYSKVSDKYLGDALKILSEADTQSQLAAAGSNKYQIAKVKEDKLISQQEFQSAYSRIQALVGDQKEAAAIMDRAWNTGGYQRWKW